MFDPGGYNDKSGRVDGEWSIFRVSFFVEVKVDDIIQCDSLLFDPTPPFHT